MDPYYKVVYMQSPELVTDGIGATKMKLGWVVGGQESAITGKIDVSHVHMACYAASLSKPANTWNAWGHLTLLGFRML